MRSSEPKVGKTVEARTVRGTEYVRGKITNVIEGPNGKFYEVTPKGGKPFRTRASCVK